MPKTVTSHYLDGIKTAREDFRIHGMEIAHEELAALDRTIKKFGADHPVGQMLRGERDFWKNQIKIHANK